MMNVVALENKTNLFKDKRVDVQVARQRGYGRNVRGTLPNGDYATPIQLNAQNRAKKTKYIRRRQKNYVSLIGSSASKYISKWLENFCKSK